MRNYKRKRGSNYTRISEYDAETLQKARDAVSAGTSIRTAAEKFSIKRETLRKALKRSPSKVKCALKPGRSPVLNAREEELIVKKILVCAEWGYPIDRLEIRCIVKAYLDEQKRKELRFKENLPNIDWVRSFLQRHQELTARMCQNIKSVRSKVDAAAVNSYFDNLEETLDEVPAANILNYDETNLTDDPGSKKVITKRGTKRVDRILDATKQSTSIMMAGTGDGKLLPPYIVYKSIYLHDIWCNGGPPGCRFNTSKSGWFDQKCFEDWFESVALRYLKDLPGKKVIIGDNLSSHLSVNVITKCEENNISFVFLPPNSTHILQPLDVAFFRPFKMAWSRVLTAWKTKHAGTLGKAQFPHHLSLALESMQNTPSILKSGFRKCGLIPINRNPVLATLPQSDLNSSAESDIDRSFREFLAQNRFPTSTPNEKQRKKRLQVNELFWVGILVLHIVIVSYACTPSET